MPDNWRTTQIIVPHAANANRWKDLLMIKPCCVCGVKDHIENMIGIWFVDNEPMEQWICQHCWDDVNGRLPTGLASAGDSQALMSC